MSKRRAGFTLIELLIVVVIIGILAAIAIPKFGETRERANQAAVKSDIRNLLTAQEQYYGDAGAGFADLNTIQTAQSLWAPSSGVTAAITAGSDNFSVVATKGTAVCTMTYYVAGATAVAATNGVPVC